MNFEDLDNHAQLHDEIAVRGIYKFDSLIFKPDVVFDIGANIGVFTHYAHKLFPDALIVAVEPDPAAFAVLQKYAPPDNVIVLHAGIGSGQLRRHVGDTQGEARSELAETAGVSYYSEAYGYSPGVLDHPTAPTGVPSIMLDELYAQYVSQHQRFAIKLDCEGAENILIEHPPSVEVMRKADLVSAELHPYWMMGHERAHGDRDKMVLADQAIAARMAAIFKDTHRHDSEVPMYYAWRRPDDEPIAGRGEFGAFLAERGLTGHAAEIGVATGCYSLEMLQWGMKTVLMVDPWKPPWDVYYQEAMDKVAEFGARAIVCRTTSVEAARLVPDGHLDFCYIDADHVNGIEGDLAAWWPKVKSGGIIAGHDYLHPAFDVNRAVTKFAATHDLHVHLIIEHQNDASFWIEKP